MNSAATSRPGEGVYRPCNSSEARKERLPLISALLMESRAALMSGGVTACCCADIRLAPATRRAAAPKVNRFIESGCFVADELIQYDVALVVHLLVNADRRGVIGKRSGLFQLREEFLGFGLGIMLGGC